MFWLTLVVETARSGCFVTESLLALTLEKFSLFFYSHFVSRSMDSILVMKTITAKRNSKVKYIRTVLIRLNNPQLKGESRMQYVTMTFAGGGLSQMTF